MNTVEIPPIQIRSYAVASSVSPFAPRKCGPGFGETHFRGAKGDYPATFASVSPSAE